METKEYAVLNYLFHHTEGWCTAASMAARLEMSPRSIKTYIASMNDQCSGIIESSPRGFRLADPKRAGELLKNQKETAGQTPESRRSYVLRRLLIECESCALERLAEELYVSPVTLERELRQMKVYLQDYGLRFQIRRGVVQIEGSERNKKRIVSALIFEESKNFFNNMHQLNAYFPEIDLELLRDIVEKELAAHQCFLNDYSISNLVLHIAITVQRNKRGLSIPEEEPSNRRVQVEAEYQQIVRNICQTVQEEYGVEFSDSDRYAFSVILITRLIHLHTAQAEDMLETSVRRLVLLIVQRVEETFSLQLGESDFLVRFGLHIKNMLIRFHGGIYLRNPQTQLIKNKYPYIYDIAVFIAGVIDEETRVRISEDEIAYIALHIGGLIEEQNASRSKVKAVLISPQYYAGAPAVLQRLTRVFSDSLFISAVMRSVEGLQTLHGIELVLSTIPIETPLPIPLLQISPFGGAQDDHRITDRVEKIRRERLQNTIREKLQTFFKPELFYPACRFATQAEAIHKMSTALRRYGYVDEGFEQKLVQRETVSSSAYCDIAVPHPLDMDAKSTAIAVALLEHPLVWGQQKVKIIMMLAITKEDRPLFRNIFDVVTQAIVDPDRLSQLLRAKTYDEFINLLISES